MKRCDALIVGDGPAGAATALLLARAGCSVVLIGRADSQHSGFSETVPPKLLVWLHRLGLAEQFVMGAHRASPGILAVWGDSSPHENDYLFTPYGSGWIINRAEFNEMMTVAASGAGALTLRSTSESVELATLSGGHQVFVSDASSALHEFRPELLVAASGRHCSLHPRLGKRIRHDNLIGVGMVFETWDETQSPDDRLFLESCECGWWYSAPSSSGNGLFCALMTDGDLFAKRSALPDLSSALSRTIYIAPRIGPNSFREVRAVSAGTSRAETIVHHRYLAIGDAAFALDPLWGHGVTRAIQSGFRAAAACLKHLSGRTTALAQYGDDVIAEYDDSIVQLRSYYAQEARWHRAPFWSRRIGTK